MNKALYVSRVVSTVILLGLICQAEAARPKGGNSANNGSTNNSSNATPTATQPSASGSPSSAAIESQMLAYGAIDHISRRIAYAICEGLPPPAPPVATETAGPSASKAFLTTLVPARIESGSTIVIYDQASFASIQTYIAFKAYAGVVEDAYNKLSADYPLANETHHQLPIPFGFKVGAHLEAAQGAQVAAQGAATPTPGVDTQTAADFIPLLSAMASSSNAETPGSITIPDSAIAISVARELANAHSCPNKLFNVYYPPLFGAGSAGDLQVSQITSTIATVETARQSAHEAVAKLAPSDQRATAAQADLADIDTSLYDAFVSAFLTPNTSASSTGNPSLVQGYQLATLIAPKLVDRKSTSAPAYVILASVVAAGGTERDHKTFWTSLTTGDKITYSGGAIVNFALWKGYDQPLVRQVLRYYVPFTTIAAPCNTNGVDAGSNFGTPYSASGSKPKPDGDVQSCEDGGHEEDQNLDHFNYSTIDESQ